MQKTVQELTGAVDEREQQLQEYQQLLQDKQVGNGVNSFTSSVQGKILSRDKNRE